MKRLIFVVMAAGLLPSAVQAQIPRTFVSAARGSDSNPCTASLPCRSFGAALANTFTGGDLVVLDSGGYGPATITNSVNFYATGIYAGVTASSGDGILVNAGASDVVFIRGLSLTSTGGLHGIRFVSGAALHVTDLQINRFGVSGIHFTPSSGTAFLVVKDSTFVRNGAGVLVDAGASAEAHASLERIMFERSVLYGLEVRDRAKVAIRDSSVAGGDFGYVATPDDPGSESEVDIERCIVTGAFTGVVAGGSGGTATVRVSNSTITMNDTGLAFTQGSAILSRVNNTLEGNATNGAFTGTFLAK